jgi:hypothetical protein
MNDGIEDPLPAINLRHVRHDDLWRSYKPTGEPLILPRGCPLPLPGMRLFHPIRNGLRPRLIRKNYNINFLQKQHDKECCVTKAKYCGRRMRGRDYLPIKSTIF